MRKLTKNPALKNLLLILLLLPHFAFTQNKDSLSNIKITDSIFKNKSEVYFNFCVKDKSEINNLSRVISIAGYKKNCVHAFANKNEFLKFLNYNYKYNILPHPGSDSNPKMSDKIQKKKSEKKWNFYPTYNAYEQQMMQFAIDYPQICKLDTIAILESGKKILSVIISGKNRNTGPRVFYTSTMHGNEVTGYVLMLHLIDSLLSSYGSSQRITNMIDNINIYINPLANPDGTYKYSLSNIALATRSNANGVDLNRNFPDFKYGNNPDANPQQEETTAFINYAFKHKFNLSLNFHTGSEVFNYPWDNNPLLTADDNWWRCVANEFVDTIHKYSANVAYFSEEFEPGNMAGVTNGYQWYQITGGRQDYMNYYHHCKEATVELSYAYIPQASDLPKYWKYTSHSLLNHIEKSIQGINGYVRDSFSNKPLKALITLLNHDKDSSQVFSSLPEGYYFRYVNAGTYDIHISAKNYIPKTFQNITISGNCDSTLILNAELSSSVNINNIPENNPYKPVLIPNPSKDYINIHFQSYPGDLKNIEIYTLISEKLYSYIVKPDLKIVLKPDLSPGLYFIKLNYKNHSQILKTIIR